MPVISVMVSTPPRVRDPDMHHGTCVMRVLSCMPESLTIGFIWSRWRGKYFRHSRRMWNPHFYVSGKRAIKWCPTKCVIIISNARMILVDFLHAIRTRSLYLKKSFWNSQSNSVASIEYYYSHGEMWRTEYCLCTNSCCGTLVSLNQWKVQ